MQRNRILLLTRIRNTMQSQLIRHIRDFVLFIHFMRDSAQRRVFRIIARDCRPSVARLGQRAAQDFHYAVGVGVAGRRLDGRCVVDGGREVGGEGEGREGGGFLPRLHA
jgi:hypothetical protein